MTAVIRPTNMALAFINTTAALANSKAQMPWTGKHVMENCERESCGLVKEINEINISGTAQSWLDRKLRNNLPGLCGEL